MPNKNIEYFWKLKKFTPNPKQKEAKVGWDDYQADHIFPHSSGGSTDVENGQVLCSYHNQVKSDNI